MNRFCELVESCEKALRKSRYDEKVLMFWYGVLTEAVINLEITDTEMIPNETWDTYEAICDIATRTINKVRWTHNG